MGATALSVTTLRIFILSIKGLNVALCITVRSHYAERRYAERHAERRYAECRYAERHYAECRCAGFWVGARPYQTRLKTSMS